VNGGFEFSHHRLQERTDAWLENTGVRAGGEGQQQESANKGILRQAIALRLDVALGAPILL